LLQEELGRSKETHDHTRAVFEKEIKKARKEAFKSSSSLLKVQEELKATRNGLKMTQANLESTKLKTTKHENDAFTAQYQLVGVSEELQKALERIKVVEEERETLKLSLKEEEVARIASQGRIALPSTNEDDDMELLSSPTKSPRKITPSSDSEKENTVPKKAIQLKSLQEELIHERKLREKAQDQVEFMKMECQFQCCSCRIAENSGTEYIHDGSHLLEMERIKSTLPLPETAMDVDMPEPGTQLEPEQHSTPRAQIIELEDDIIGQESMLRSTPTILDDTVIEKVDFAPQAPPYREESSHTIQQETESEPPSPEKSHQLAFVPVTPDARSFKTVTTTTTVPMMFSPALPKPELQPTRSAPSTPNTISHPSQYHLGPSPFPSRALNADGTIDREAALELIRQRRGRARSVAMGHATPGKQMVEGTVRRDISAPSMKAGKWSR
jgi:hypothetical protein